MERRESRPLVRRMYLTTSRVASISLFLSILIIHSSPLAPSASTLRFDYYWDHPTISSHSSICSLSNRLVRQNWASHDPCPFPSCAFQNSRFDSATTSGGPETDNLAPHRQYIEILCSVLIASAWHMPGIGPGSPYGWQPSGILDISTGRLLPPISGLSASREYVLPLFPLQSWAGYQYSFHCFLK